MLDELKLLIETVASVPQMALWVAFGFLFYKVFIWGSVVGAALKAWQMGNQSFREWSAAREGNRLAVMQAEVEKALIDKSPKATQLYLGKIAITGEEGRLEEQVKRIAGKRTGIGSKYIHNVSIDWLREAIDEKEAREASGEEGSDEG